MVRDMIGRADEKLPGEPLLQLVMKDGERQEAGRVMLNDARRHAQHEQGRMPESLMRLTLADSPYPTQISAGLRQDFEVLRRALEHYRRLLLLKAIQPASFTSLNIRC